MGVCGSKQIEYNYDGELTHYETSSDYWCFNEHHKNELQIHLELYQLDILLPIIISYIDFVNLSWEYPNYHTYIHIDITPLNYNYNGIPIEWKHYNKDIKKKKKESNDSGINILLNRMDDREQDCYGIFKILMLGKDGVGKSSLTIRFVSNKYFEETDETIEDDWRKLCTLNVPKNKYDEYNDEYIENNISSLQNNRYQIADVSCDYQWGFMRMSNEYYKESQIFLLVFDVMDKETFERVQLYREQIIRARNDILNDNYLIMIVGNKCDLRNDLKFRSETNKICCEMNKVFKWIQENELPFIETSAKENKNVHLLFRQCIYEYWIQTIKSMS